MSEFVYSIVHKYITGDGDITPIADLHPPELLNWPSVSRLGAELYIKRDDRIDHQLSGNKLFKLMGFLRNAYRHDAQRLVSFGGFYSNHLHALAALGGYLGIQTHAIVRGHKPDVLTQTLQDCVSHGMTLEFVSRVDYRNYRAEQSCGPQSNGDYLIPEGGCHPLGLEGVSSLMKSIERWNQNVPLTVILPCGTGTTLAGLLSARTNPNIHILGISALKLGQNQDYFYEQCSHLLGGDISRYDDWSVYLDGHFGGFGKSPPELLALIRAFEAETGVLLDPVYTGKMVWSIQELLKNDKLPRQGRYLLLHTGGLQGRNGVAGLTASSSVVA